MKNEGNIYVRQVAVGDKLSPDKLKNGDLSRGQVVAGQVCRGQVVAGQVAITPYICIFPACMDPFFAQIFALYRQGRVTIRYKCHFITPASGMYSFCAVRLRPF
jgi:hypothetical protein